MEQTSQAERILQLEIDLVNTVTLLYGKAARKHIRGMSSYEEFQDDCYKTNKLQSEFMEGIRDAKSMLNQTEMLIKSIEEQLEAESKPLKV
jgi:hypothetical protein